MDIELELSLYEKSLKDLSENTIYNYKLDVKQFLNWKHKDEVIDEDLLDEYKTELINDFAIKTVNRKLNALNAYLRFKGIDIHIKSAKIQNQTFVDDMLTNDEAKAILNVIKEHQRIGNNRSKEKAKRAEALFLGLFYTGARVSELLQLKPRNISKDEVTIKGKGDKYRKILVPVRLTETLEKYAKDGRRDNGSLLFTGQRGNITRNTVFTTLKEYAVLANVNPDKVYPHAIRHLYAKNLGSKGVSYSAIKQLLGHSLSTTDIYMQLSKKELLEVINSISLD